MLHSVIGFMKMSCFIHKTLLHDKSVFGSPLSVIVIVVRIQNQ